MSLDNGSTLREDADGGVHVRRFRLVILDAPDTGSAEQQRGLAWESKVDRCALGSSPLSDLRLEDRKVSRFHCEIRVEKKGFLALDLGSRNGTFVDGVRIESAYLRDGSLLRLGTVVVRFELLEQSNRLPVYNRSAFGGMVSRSIAMRQCFALMARAATSDATVLFEGETGTGKTAAAEAIHRESARRNNAFLVVDCSALARSLIEDELFGHEKDAFTGATTRRKGVFEEADGGTIFLDEVGEMPLELQSKLLRVLENREVRRLGGNVPIKVDVRVIAATHRDLRAEMNAGHFRADLYYRLAVLRARLPALRERPEDIPVLCDRLLDELQASPDLKRTLCTAEFFSDLKQAAWPGNIRELRNHLERCTLFGDQMGIDGPVAEQGPIRVDASRRYKDEKDRALLAFERTYLQELIHLYGGNVTRAAEGAGVARGYLHKLLRRHGIRHE